MAIRLDVVFSPLGLPAQDLAGRTVFVIDILRATSAMAAALHHGARAIIPVASTEEAMKLSQTLGREDTLLCGERECRPIPGFDLGNSPLEMTPERVKGRTLVMTTTNGTRALLATSAASAVYAAAAVNLAVSAARAAQALEAGEPVVILCAGRENAFALEDAYCAGRLALAALGGKPRVRGLGDAAVAALDLVRRYRDRWPRPLLASEGGKRLRRLGYGPDVEACATPDAYPVLAQFHDRRVTRVATA
ncbi:MAG: 2-phosphosulfolactate phosphatase [Gemmatimonadales bacterium]|nr:2-phosphosulfolactate phosphatase [Gemmatimonadales bacterium]